MRKYGILRWVVCGLILALSMPEGFDQRFSYGVVFFGHTSLHAADLVAVALLSLALIAVLVFRSVIKTQHCFPLALLAAILLTQGIRTYGVYELRDIIRDIRPIVPLLAMIALPQIFRSPKLRERWAEWGVAVVLAPPLVVALFTILRYLIGGSFLTAGEAVTDRMLYVNSSLALLVAMSGVSAIITHTRKHYLVHFSAIALSLVLLVLSGSRGLLIDAVLVMSLLLCLALFRGRALFYGAALAVPLLVTILITGVFFTRQASFTINRMASLADVNASIFGGHDSLRIMHMQQQFSDFLHYPLFGTGLGRPYYALGGMRVGQRLSSASDSLVIEIAAKTGAIGIGAILWVFFLHWRTLWWLRSPTHLSQLSHLHTCFVYGLLITFPSMMIGNIMGNALWHYRTAPLHMAVVMSVVESLYQMRLRRLG